MTLAGIHSKEHANLSPRVGSLGECLVADAYGLTLQPASNKGYDAITASGREVEIKATQADSVGFRSQPTHAIIIKILETVRNSV